MGSSRASLVLSNVEYEKSNTNIFNKAFAKRTSPTTHSGQFVVKVLDGPSGDIGHLLEDAALNKKFRKKKRSPKAKRSPPPASAYEVEEWHQLPDTT